MVVILLPLTVSYKNSSGFSRTNFSVKHRPFLYLLTFVLVIKPLLFLYIVSGCLYSQMFSDFRNDLFWVSWFCNFSNFFSFFIQEEKFIRVRNRISHNRVRVFLYYITSRKQFYSFVYLFFVSRNSNKVVMKRFCVFFNVLWFVVFMVNAHKNHTNIFTLVICKFSIGIAYDCQCSWTNRTTFCKTKIQ